MNYIPTIGLEIHAQLNTKTKMFCDSLNNPDETKPNVNICPICLAHPGTLPVANIEAVKKVIKVGLALHCNIREYSWFERKNYFYPDLPKGYQISQYESPFCEGGELELSSGSSAQAGKKINITRIHLEEDTGRLLHNTKAKESLVDFNRAGIPLMELVTEPDLESAKEVREFGEEFQLLLRYLDVSGADMEKGQLRLEANVSVRAENTKKLGTKVELKNINSFKALERAIDYELKRQEEVLKDNKKIIQETRGWDEKKQQTFSQRVKEGSDDYRYFPEPDLPPIRLESTQIEGLKRELPELPQQRRTRFIDEYGIKAEDAQLFTKNKELGNYFENSISELKRWMKDEKIESKKEKELIKLTANYLISELQGLISESGIDIGELKVNPENFAELMIMIHKGTISSSGAQDMLKAMFESGQDPSQLLDDLNLTQVSDEGELESAAKAVIKENPSAVKDYKKGKKASLQFMVGQLMRHMKGRANPQIATEILKKLLT
jgi:aspartyl-tRNA(Asn)/glutamyl-tRNA(Gln) amidotransferase subunit B